MILKIMDSNGEFTFKKCNALKLKCNVDKVVYLKNDDIVGYGKWSAYDVDSGLLITKAKTKKELIEKVNELKDKIEEIRSTEYYQKQIKIKEEFETKLWIRFTRRGGVWNGCTNKLWTCSGIRAGDRQS